MLPWCSAALILLCVQELQRCESAGIMCLIAEAFPKLYLDACGDTSICVPAEELELDLRGRIDISGNGEFVYIDIGEVKRTQGYKKAVEQLGLRLGALQVFITASVPHEHPDVRLVGRLFVSKGTMEDDIDVPGDQRSRARDEWSYSLYVHRF